jgi:hypothetical protein
MALSLIDQPQFTATPTFGKLAIGGLWEQALTFRPSDLTPQDVEELLGEHEEIACEAFFGSAFFGVRTHRTDAVEFVVAFAQSMRSVASGSAFFEAVRDLGVDLEAGFRFAELGAEGAWRSVGPLRIVDPCAALCDAESLWHEVMSSPVGRDRLHDKALEFTFSGGKVHWFALPVSDQHVMSRRRLEDALRAFCP